MSLDHIAYGDAVLLANGFGVVLNVNAPRDVVLILLQNGKWMEASLFIAWVGAGELRRFAVYEMITPLLR